jgi:hypothetical protein
MDLNEWIVSYDSCAWSVGDSMAPRRLPWLLELGGEGVIFRRIPLSPAYQLAYRTEARALP